MSDMRAVIQPKSDQLNADDLLAGPMTITITSAMVKAGQDQPVSIFHGDGKRPWKPCLSMRRVLVAAWGPDSAAYAGRAVTLYRDPTAKWGGQQVGGIRISHISHIREPLIMALTESKQARKIVKIMPLEMSSAAPAAKTLMLWTPAGLVECASGQEWITTLEGWLKAGTDETGAIWENNKPTLDAMQEQAEKRGDTRALAFISAVSDLKPGAK